MRAACESSLSLTIPIVPVLGDVRQSPSGRTLPEASANAPSCRARAIYPARGATRMAPLGGYCGGSDCFGPIVRYITRWSQP